MRTPITKNEALLQQLLKKGSLSQTLVKAMNEQKYSGIFNLINSYKTHIIALGRRAEYRTEFNRAFDCFQKTLDALPENTHPVFLSIVSVAMELNSASYMPSDEDYKTDWVDRRERQDDYTAEVDKDRAALKDHPFVSYLRDSLTYVEGENSLEILLSLWESGNQQGFFYYHDALTPIYAQRNLKGNPAFSGETFKDKIASYPGLELVILDVSRGTTANDSLGMASLPKLRVLVSNKAIPNEYDLSYVEEDNTEEGWQSLKMPEFHILTAQGEYTDLKSYMHRSLSVERESRASGPYDFVSNDDATYATAANVMATINDYLRKPLNFEASAQERLKEQVATIETSTFAPVYMHRFLRAQEWSDWAAALTLANSRRPIEDTIDYKTAAKTLVLYGFPKAVNWMDRGFGLGDEVDKINEGYVEGINELYAHMKDLARMSETQTPSLDWYERERGFHPDVMMLSVPDRKKLAFQDLSNIMIAHLTGYKMSKLYSYENRKLKGQVQGQERSSVIEHLSKVPLDEIEDFYIKSGDVKNFMRLLAHYEFSFKEAYVPKLADKIRKSGYLDTGRLVINTMNDLECSAVFDRSARLFLLTRDMAHHKSVEEIIDDENLFEVLAAHQVISNVNIPESLENSKRNQLDALIVFIDEKKFSHQFKEGLEKVSVEERQCVVEILKQTLPHFVDEWTEGEGLSEEGMENVKSTVVAGFEDATGTKQKPLLSRAVSAYTKVRHLFLNRT